MSDITNYKKARLEQQVEWHSKKARHNKLRFSIYQIITLIAGAIIPLINIANIGDFQTHMISSIIGGIIAVATYLTISLAPCVSMYDFLPSVVFVLY
jgi:predicted membrane channel-forming protein YqfA (hemolysin III family)